MSTPNLHALGWDAAWAEWLASSKYADAAVGRVARMETSVVTLWGAGEPVLAQLPTRLKAPEDRPAVGDWAVFQPGPPTAKVREILPRRTLFERRAAGRRTQRQVVAANVDVVFVVSGLDGDFNPRRIERYLAAVAHSKARPVVMLTKAAALSDNERARVREASEAVAGDAPVHLIDVIDGSTRMPRRPISVKAPRLRSWVRRVSASRRCSITGQASNARKPAKSVRVMAGGSTPQRTASCSSCATARW